MYKHMLSFAHLIGGILLAGMALLGFFVVSSLLALFYLVYRFFWLFSGAARKQKLERKFKRRKEKLLRRERIMRSEYANLIDRESTISLVEITLREIGLRKDYLDSFVYNEILYLLNRCQHDRDFKKALRIHDIVKQTEASLLNLKLAKLIDEFSAFH
jgi:hypothetical protein